MKELKGTFKITVRLIILPNESPCGQRNKGSCLSSHGWQQLWYESSFVCSKSNSPYAVAHEWMTLTLRIASWDEHDEGWLKGSHLVKAGKAEKGHENKGRCEVEGINGPRDGTQKLRMTPLSLLLCFAEIGPTALV